MVVTVPRHRLASRYQLCGRHETASSRYSTYLRRRNCTRLSSFASSSAIDSPRALRTSSCTSKQITMTHSLLLASVTAAYPSYCPEERRHCFGSWFQSSVVSSGFLGSECRTVGRIQGPLLTSLMTGMSILLMCVPTRGVACKRMARLRK